MRLWGVFAASSVQSFAVYGWLTWSSSFVNVFAFCSVLVFISGTSVLLVLFVRPMDSCVLVRWHAS